MALKPQSVTHPHPGNVDVQYLCTHAACSLRCAIPAAAGVDTQYRHAVYSASRVDTQTLTLRCVRCSACNTCTERMSSSWERSWMPHLAPHPLHVAKRHRDLKGGHEDFIGMSAQDPAGFLVRCAREGLDALLGAGTHMADARAYGGNASRGELYARRSLRRHDASLAEPKFRWYE